MSKVLVTEEYLSDIGDAIRGKLGGSSQYTPSQMASAIGRIPVVSPTLISKTILSNGTYNASEDEADGYDSVSVDVPNSYSAQDEGKVVSSGALSIQGVLSVYSNSIYDTTFYSQVSVDVLPPVLVSKTISENGTYNPAEDNADAYSQVVVNISGGGGSNDELYTAIGFSSISGTLDLRNMDNVPEYAFYFNRALTGITGSNVSIIYYSAFDTCTHLKSATFPECTNIGTNAFFNCGELEVINISNCKIIPSGCFQNCERLSEIYLLSCSSIGSNAFFRCSSLHTLVLKSSSLVTLSGNSTFRSTPMSNSTYLGRFGSIYVPASLVNSYKSASLWSVYSDRITSIVEE